ncbi:L-Fucosyltransferase, partial [Gryllus bimaculatus]
MVAKYIVLAKAIAPMQSKMKEEFTYQPQYLSYAEKTLRESVKGLHNSTFGEEISYVGVHVRLTDYPRYLQERFGLKREDLAHTDYYVRAMEYMLKRLREDGISKVVFAVVSDGMNWTKKILIPQLENYLKSKELLGTNAI